MEIFLALLTVYLIVGIVFCFYGRFAFKIDKENAMVSLQEEVSTAKRMTFIIVLRLGVILLYPYFLYSQ